MGQSLFELQLRNKILILDGAMGTMIQKAGLTAEDFGGTEYEGCNEYLNLTCPELIRRIHEAYLEAGADIIETNTFGATQIVLSEYGLEDQDIRINREAARIAAKAAEVYFTPDHPRFVAGAIGPTTKMLSLTGGVTFDALAEAYYRQTKGLLEGGVDVLLLETSQDTLNVKAAGIGIQQAMEALGKRVPVMISGTIELTGTTLAGQNIEAFYVSLEHLQPVSIGLNCSTGPEFMREHVRTVSRLAHCGVSCYPNAGLPDEEGHYHESPEMLAKQMAQFAEQGWLNIAGGCCGTTPDHVRALVKALRPFQPRPLPYDKVSAISGLDVLYLEEENRPILVGERTNVIGSRKFRQLIAEQAYEEASEIARAQVKKGAQVIDICLADPDRNEYEDLAAFLPYVVKKVKAPLMFDSTDPAVLELGLKHSQGKALINSINLEDGTGRFDAVVPLIKKYGAAIIVGTMDEVGMAVSRERKLEVARRAYDLLVQHYGIPPQDIIFDPLVFPVGTGDAQYIGSALETIEGIRLIKATWPECKTVLGISNVSFGLPPAGREVLNAAFLYHTTKAGLDYALVNAEKLKRYASISEEERLLAEDVLFGTNDETISRFAAYYRGKSEKPTEPAYERQTLSVSERLTGYVVEGSKDGLLPDLKEALDTANPLDIINGPLMSGMDEVGRLFNANQLIVAEVLQSAEVMKAAVSYLETFMEKEESARRGKLLLATVKGDVHDIGKNLVEMILGNNGYQVLNLGTKVSSEQLIEACRKECPDTIGLSGLLVKSAQQMVLAAQDLRAAGIDIPLIVGGAALTRKFTQTRITPEYDGLVLYAKDAMHGLELMNKLRNPEERERLVTAEKAAVEGAQKNTAVSNIIKSSSAETSLPNENVEPHYTVEEHPSAAIPPDFERHELRDVPLSQLKPFLNLQMLLGKHLGIRGSIETQLSQGEQKVTALFHLIEELLQEAEENGIIRAQGVYRFFPAQRDGDNILIFNPLDQSEVLERLHFPRQAQEPYYCVADFLNSVQSGVMDYIGLFALTSGVGVAEKATEWKEEGEYLRAHALQALALALAEAFAERIHQLMRERWGFPDPETMTQQERFKAHYQGIRVSFGYPACPDLEGQKPLFRLLNPETLGIQLTEGFMMDPEASVTALVFSHPGAHYFNVNP